MDSSFAVISTESGLFITYDGGINWQKINSPWEPISVCDISLINQNYFWVVTDDGRIFYTSNGGIDWYKQFGDYSVTPFLFFVKMFDLKNGIAIGDAPFYNSRSAPILKTTDGTNWIKINSDTTFINRYSNGRWRKANFPSMNIGYFCTTDSANDELFKTTNGGKNWFFLSLPSYHSINVIKFYDDNIGLIFINKKINNDFKSYIFRTKDGGLNWQEFKFINDGIGNEIEFIKGNPSKVWLTDALNLYFSSDTGRTFIKYDFNTDNLKGRDICFVDDKVGWFLCDSNKVFRNINGNQFTFIEKNFTISTSEIKLFQNYPNPFFTKNDFSKSNNFKTKINYLIPIQSFISLKIFDILGREINTLINDELKEAGMHTFEISDWIIDFSSGMKQTSGIYFYQLIVKNESGIFTETKKMQLIK